MTVWPAKSALQFHLNLGGLADGQQPEANCSLLLGSVLLGFLLASAEVASVGPGDSGLGVRVALLHVGGDGLERILVRSGCSGENLSADLIAGGGRLNLGGGGVVDETLLGLAVLAWEEDQLGLVGVETLSVQLELLLARGRSPVVDSNSNGAGEAGTEASSLELSEGEAPAVSDLAGVPARAGRDDRSELLDGAGEHFAAFLLSALQSSELFSWLVEVDSDSSLPVLAQVYVWDDVVVLDHC